MSSGERTLRLLALLQSRRHWAGSDLAGRLGISLRTLRRDVERLRDLGYPVQAAPGAAGGYRLAAGAALPPLLWDDDEAVALAVALRTATSVPVLGMAEASVRALARLTQVLPARLRGRVEAIRLATTGPAFRTSGPPAAAVDPDLLVELSLACRDTERVRFDFTPADGPPSHRWVEPLRLVALRRRWYLVGYDLDRTDWRSFRLDRLDRVGRTGESFRPRELPGDDPVAFVMAGITRVQPHHRVEALVAAPAAAVAAAVGRWVMVTPVTDADCRLTAEVDDLNWALFALAASGADFQIIGPPELQDRLEEWSGRFARARSR